MTKGLDLEWSVSPGLYELPPELRPSGLRFTIVQNHPEHLQYRGVWIQFASHVLPTAECAWIAVKDGRRRRGAIVIFRTRVLSQIQEKLRNGFMPESLPAEKIMLRLVREGFGRAIR